MSYNYKTWTKLEPKKANIDQKYRWLQYPSLPNTAWEGVLGMLFGVQIPPHKISQRCLEAQGVGSRVVQKYLHFQTWPSPTSMLNWPSFSVSYSQPPRKKKKNGRMRCARHDFCEEQEWAPTTSAWRPRLNDSDRPLGTWKYKYIIYHEPPNIKSSNNVGLGAHGLHVWRISFTNTWGSLGVCSKGMLERLNGSKSHCWTQKN